MTENLKIDPKPPWKRSRPELPGQLKRGGTHESKKKKYVRVNKKVEDRKDND